MEATTLIYWVHEEESRVLLIGSHFSVTFTSNVKVINLYLGLFFLIFFLFKLEQKSDFRVVVVFAIFPPLVRAQAEANVDFGSYERLFDLNIFVYWRLMKWKNVVDIFRNWVENLCIYSDFQTDGNN